jgi:uncharacterized protein YjbI with pentapeptide repeats
MANPEHVGILGQGVVVWNHWRQETHPLKPDLSGLSLKGINLLTANLSGADFSGTDLAGATLRVANLRACQLRDANLSRAELLWADLTGAHLEGANFSDALVFGTIFGRLDEGPSVLDLATVYASRGRY